MTAAPDALAPNRPGGPPSGDPDVAGARRAASVILLRDGPHGPEVLLLRRAERQGDSRSGIWVFPGGVLDPVDPTLHGRCDGLDDPEASRRLGLPRGGLDYAVAAVRECFEEVGLLLARGRPQALADAVAAQAEVHDGPSFVQALERHDLRLALDALVYHAHWLTPPGIPQRFDTRFFLARAPADQPAVADAGEALEVAWLRPAEALARGLRLLPVTEVLLRELAGAATVQAALDAARNREVSRQMPRLGRDAQGRRPVMPWEPAWAELGRLDPGGRGDAWATLVPGRVVALSPRVRRLTCANASMMTGPGTNTYLIGAEGDGPLAVLDPGPDDAGTEAHLQALLAAAGDRPIRWILVSHTHRDHSPAARRLKALTGAECLGWPAAPAPGQDTGFQPDRPVQDGERWPLGPGCTLRAVHTPGHASNHLCWWLEEEALLFTGDQVMQGSTVVINPPDGDMAAYLDSLWALAALPLAWLAPGHGFLIDRPVAALEALVAHRLAREARVLQAVAAAPAAGASMAELLPAVYGDVPVQRHALAERSLLAHLLKLQAEQRVQEQSGAWRAA